MGIIRTFEGFEKDFKAEEVFHIAEIEPEIGKRAVYIQRRSDELFANFKPSLKALTLDVLVELHKYKASNESRTIWKRGLITLIGEMNFPSTKPFQLAALHILHFSITLKYVSIKNKRCNCRSVLIGIMELGSNVDRVAPDHKFIVRVTHDQVNLLWNTSGDPLFKRKDTGP